MMKSKKENIAEYILYLWQMEDYLRAFPQNAEATPELHDLNEMMHREGILEGGHLALAQNALAELEELHRALLDEDAMYRAAIIRMQPSLNLLKAKTDRPTMSDIIIPDHASSFAKTRDQSRNSGCTTARNTSAAILKQELSRYRYSEITRYRNDD